VTPGGPLSTDAVVRMLAAFGDRSPDQVDDVVGSLELTWLIAEIEEDYDVVIDLSPAELDAIHTVADASRVLSGALLP
jgi:acyl carrier protein